jgi:hypothetical protein
MTRAIVSVFIVFILVLSACTQRTICPAFQSAFIYDKESLRKKFSYFQEDSTPKLLTASRNRYLVAEPMAYSRKLQKLQTVEMKDIQPIVPDSLSSDEDVSQAELDSAARSVIDSTYIADVQPKDSVQESEEDSVYVITKDKEVRVLRFNKDSISYHVDEVRYNIDQDNYMWYLRDVLVLPDVRLAQLQATEDKDAKKERKGIKGFFRNLFKKKKKEEAMDSVSVLRDAKSEFDIDYVEPHDSIDFDNIDQDSITQVKKEAMVAPEKTKKEKKKKEKKNRDKKKEEVIPPKKEEPDPIINEKKEEDDGGF